MPQVDAFATCLPIILAQEGGFSDDRQDKGGPTALGVTQSNWQAWIGHPVSIADMKALTPTIVAPFYRTNYWQAASCDKLPLAIALCTFDFAVNSGVGRAAKELQHIVGAPADGHIGVQTMLDVQQYVRANGLKSLVRSLQSARQTYLKGLDGFAHFGNGWLARVDRITAKALALAV